MRMKPNQKRAMGLMLAVLAVVAGILAGCAMYPQDSDWRWKQMNPDWKPLPGDPTY